MVFVDPIYCDCSVAGGPTCGLGPFFLLSHNTSYHGIEAILSVLYLDPQMVKKRWYLSFSKPKWKARFPIMVSRSPPSTKLLRDYRSTPPINGTQVQTLFKCVSVSFLYVLAKYWHYTVKIKLQSCSDPPKSIWVRMGWQSKYYHCRGFCMGVIPPSICSSFMSSILTWQQFRNMKRQHIGAPTLSPYMITWWSS